MVRALLVRGMLVGVVAGVLAFAFAYIFGEPQVQHAIDFEHYLARIHHEPEGQEVVSRGVQRTLGLLIGTVVLSTALGGILALAFAWAYGRIGAIGARATAGILAAGAFLTITVIPYTKYPANPPTVGNPDTIGKRTTLYFLMIGTSILAAVAASRLRRTALPRLGGWNAGVLAAGTFLVVVALVELILPTLHETPEGFPADVLWHFRLASVGISATIWATLGLGFGAAADRLLATGRSSPAAPATANA